MLKVAASPKNATTFPTPSRIFSPVFTKNDFEDISGREGGRGEIKKKNVFMEKKEKKN